MATKKPKKKAEAYQTPIHFNIPVNMPSLYATNLLVQASQEEVVISFYEVQPPLIPEDPEQWEALKKIGVRADCIARITVSNSRFPGFVDLMSDFAEQLKQAQEHAELKRNT